VVVLDPSLDPVCEVTLPANVSSTAMAVGAERLYVGGDDGSVFVYKACGGTGGFAMPALWSYGPLSGAVTSIVVDLRGTDPVYVTSDEGELVSLEIDGTLIWEFQAAAGISAAPVVDALTRRLLLVDDSGMRYVLSGDGSTAFDLAPQQGAPPATELAVGSYVVRDSGGVRSFRAFFYGGDDGAIYVIQTDR
jgi:outer membrane protein assembly factor BamB